MKNIINFKHNKKFIDLLNKKVNLLNNVQNIFII